MRCHLFDSIIFHCLTSRLLSASCFYAVYKILHTVSCLLTCLQRHHLNKRAMRRVKKREREIRGVISDLDKSVTRDNGTTIYFPDTSLIRNLISNHNNRSSFFLFQRFDKFPSLSREIFNSALSFVVFFGGGMSSGLLLI